MTLARQATYINQSDWVAFRDRRIRSVAQYKLVDDPDLGGFQTGLRFASGEPKPSYDAYRLPIWVSRQGSRLRVYGQVRPAAAGRRRGGGDPGRAAARTRASGRSRRSTSAPPGATSRPGSARGGASSGCAGRR